MYLLSLPPELIVHFLVHLKARDILTFSRCCRFTRAIVIDTDELQYRIAMETMALGFPQGSILQKMSLNDRLRHIDKRETIWRELELPDDRRWTIPVNHLHSHVHSLSSGLYILGDSSPDPQSSRIVGLHYLELPRWGHSRVDDSSVTSVSWPYVPSGGEVLNIGLSVEEHDLIAILTASTLTNIPNAQSFCLLLKSFATGRPHPMALEETIHVCDYLENASHCVATITIAGSHLLLLVKSLVLGSRDEFFVYDWTRSVLLKHIIAPSFTYRDVSFLSIDTFLLTNIQQGTLEILKLRNTVDIASTIEAVWILKLGLPPLRPGKAMVSLSCCTDRIRRGTDTSNPLEHTHPRSPPFPVDTGSLAYRPPSRLSLCCQPDKALVQFRAYVQTGGLPPTENMVYFSFVVHREIILRLANESEWREGVQDSNVISPISWHAWGPEATRWGGKDEADAAWMANIAGQRNVVNSGSNPRPVCVRDYNVFAVNRRLLKADEPDYHQPGKVVVDESTTAHQDCFQDDIRSSLPYVEYTSTSAFDFDTVLVSDEHIIGLTESDDGSLNKIDVFSMTPDLQRLCPCP